MWDIGCSAIQAGVSKAQTQPDCKRFVAALATIPWVAVKHLWVLPFTQSISDAFQGQCWAPRVGLFSRNAAQPQVPPQILWVLSGTGAGRASN